MSENDSKLNPKAPSSDEGSVAPYRSSGLKALFCLMSGIELGPQLPRAVPVTQKLADGSYKLVALRFDTAAAVEDFAKGLAEFVDRDGERLFLKKAAAINRDERGNCSGVN